MSKALSRYRNRRVFRETMDGETFVLRTLTKGEARRVNALPPELRTALVMGFCMLEDDESPAFTAKEGESDEEFAKQVDVEIDDIQTDKLRDINLAIARASKPPDMDKLVKNSEGTAT